jgi:exopolysaccharide biosynthesis protein
MATTPAQTVTPEVLPPTWTPAPSATPEPSDTGWSTVRPGVEIRSLDVPVSSGESALQTERVTVARLDPSEVVFRVLYTPRVAYPVSVWAQRSDALLVITGGYFTAENLVTGLTIADGEAYGYVYDSFAGMFAVTEAGEVSVRWLRSWPYAASEPLKHAIQSFPVLVKPGGEMGFPADGDDGRPARRVVVAQDGMGRVLLLIAPRGYLSLHALAVWLADADMDVDIALNLDGGTSAGLWMPDGPQIDSLIAVPVVIGAFPR